MIFEDYFLVEGNCSNHASKDSLKYLNGVVSLRYLKQSQQTTSPISLGRLHPRQFISWRAISSKLLMSIMKFYFLMSGAKYVLLFLSVFKTSSLINFPFLSNSFIFWNLLSFNTPVYFISPVS